jgi:predicted XRE-type DNA-binding protein
MWKLEEKFKVVLILILEHIDMNKEILIYKRILHNLTVSQNVQILHAINEEMRPYTAKVLGIQSIYGTFGVELSNLSDFFKKHIKAFETEEIVNKDNKRDFTVRAVIAKAQYHYDFAFTDEEKEDARRLLYVVEKYKGVAKKEYESETALLRSLVNELQQIPDLLDRFGITDLVAKLKQENEEFETIYNTRAKNMRDKQLKGNTLKYRTAANESFDNLCKVITGLSLMSINEDEKSAIENIIDIINGQIQQATVVYNRRAGIVAGKKKDVSQER